MSALVIGDATAPDAPITPDVAGFNKRTAAPCLTAPAALVGFFEVAAFERRPGGIGRSGGSSVSQAHRLTQTTIAFAQRVLRKKVMYLRLHQSQ
jgi:hypothetical protein